MAVVEITLPRVGTPGDLYFEEPTGYYIVPESFSEAFEGSGLYPIPGYLIEGPSGVFTIPDAYAGKASIPDSRVHSFSVQEDATPIDPSSSEGGVGTITVGIDDSPDAPLYVGSIVLADGSRGKTSGIIRSAQGRDGQVSLQADSVMGLFNSEKTIQPYVGTLRGAVQYYCDLVSVVNDVVVEESVASRPVVYPGGRSNMWVWIKQMLSAEQVEMALVFDRVYVRPLRTVVADTDRMTSSGWGITNDKAARSVDVNYYNSQAGSFLEIYPLVNDEEPQILVVDAGATQVVEQKLNASVTSVNQPVPTMNVEDRSYAGTNGVYSVTGMDELPVVPAQWTAAGGYLRVEKTDDPTVIKIVIRGANIPDLSPFRIAMSSGSSNYYNSLHITGEGVAWNKKTVTIPTGAVADTTANDLGIVVDNPFIRTKNQAISTGLITAGAYAGIQYTRTGSAFALNRSEDTRALVQSTIADFNSEHFGDTISVFNAEWSGQSIQNFNTYWDDKAMLRWENQLFGNAPGARVFQSDAAFRISSAVTTETAVDFTARLDTIVSDFSNVWADGATVADFNAQFVGYTCKAMSIVPLRRST